MARSAADAEADDLPVALFDPADLRRLLGAHWESQRTRITPEAAALTSELIRVFAFEAVARAASQAQLDGDATVEPAHVERILVQLMLDF